MQLKDVLSCVLLWKIRAAELPTFKKTLEWDLSGVCHTAKPWELDAYLIIYIGWPDVLFSPDMSSFQDLKNASGRDSKNIRDFASSDICVSLGLSQTSYYALTSFGKRIFGDYGTSQTVLEASTWSTLILRHHLMPGVITLTIKVITPFIPVSYLFHKNTRESVWKHAKACVTRRNRESWQLWSCERAAFHQLRTTGTPVKSRLQQLSSLYLMSHDDVCAKTN